jgi:hypothetical protein
MTRHDRIGRYAERTESFKREWIISPGEYQRGLSIVSLGCPLQ